MPQLDEVALTTGVMTLILSIYSFYYLNFVEYIPLYTETKKSRIKIGRILTRLTHTENYETIYQVLNQKSYKKCSS